MDEQVANMIAECKRQEESCLYTATTIFEWLKEMRWWRVGFVVVPIILGGVATWPLLAKLTDLEWLTGVCALLAGLSPAVYKALNFDVSLETLAKSAHEFKILQDRFRQASRVTSLGDFSDFKTQFEALMKRMDATRAGSHTPPDRFFKKAQQKIKSGDYDFGVDLENK